MDTGITGKVAIVGGGSRGLGKAAAHALAAEGAHLMICARSEDALRKASSEISKAHGVRVEIYPGDLEQPVTIDGLIKETISRFNGLHILVSNIGGPPPGSALQLSESDWHTAINRSFLFFSRISSAVIPYMQQQEWGRIISILSSSIKDPIPNLALSTSARLGAAGYLKALSLEVAINNITVNGILPLDILTDRQYELAEAQLSKQGGTDTDEDILRLKAQTNPSGRLGLPNEVGALVAFLASEQAGFINGTNILIDGGATRSVL